MEPARTKDSPNPDENLHGNRPGTICIFHPFETVYWEAIARAIMRRMTTTAYNTFQNAQVLLLIKHPITCEINSQLISINLRNGRPSALNDAIKKITCKIGSFDFSFSFHIRCPQYRHCRCCALFFVVFAYFSFFFFSLHFLHFVPN